MAILKSGSVRKKWKFHQNRDQKFKKSWSKKSLARRKWKVDLDKSASWLIKSVGSIENHNFFKKLHRDQEKSLLS